MSVLIKGMDMPKSCSSCQLRFYDGDTDCCPFVGDSVFQYQRSDDCPLVTVPDHGRLIDADALMRHCVALPSDGGSLPVVYASYLRNAPTIIPAEEGE